MAILSRIQELATSQNTNFKQIEKAVGLGNGSIRRWETNSPSVDNFKKVADYLHTTTDYLLTGRDSPPTVSNIDPELENIISRLSDLQIGELKGYAKRMLEEQDIFVGNSTPSNGTGGTKKDSTPPVAAGSVAL